MIARRVAEQPRANQANRHDNAGSYEETRLGSRLGKPVAVDHRTQRLAHVERGGMQRRRCPAGGLREIGHMHLNGSMQEIKPKAKHGKDCDLPSP